MTKSSRRRGQSTMEYVLVVAGIIAILIAMLANGGPLYAAIQKLFDQSSKWLTSVANSLPG